MMPNFKDCIEAAILTGRIKEDKGREAQQLWQDIYDGAKSLGLTDSVADLQAAREAVKQLGVKTANAKWKKVKQIQAAAKIANDKLLKTDPARYLRELQMRFDYAHDRIVREAHKIAFDIIDEGRPRLAGLLHLRENPDIVRAAYDEPVPGDAKRLYKATAGTYEYLRKRANNNGAHIAKNKNQRLPQKQSRDKLRREARNYKTPEEAKQAWLDFMLERADWELMKYDGIEIPVDKRAEVFGAAYDSIFTDGDVRLTPGYRRAQNLADRMSRERFFYYKDAQSWMEAQQRYGAGDVRTQLVGNIDTMARHIAMLEMFGPDPTEMVNYLRNLAHKAAADIDLASGGKARAQAAVRKEQEIFDGTYKIFNRMVNNGADSKAYTALATARTVSTAGILGNAFIAQTGDFGLADTAFHLAKIPMTGYIRNYMKNFAKLPFKKRRMEAARLLGGMESQVHVALAQERYLGPLDGSYFGQRIADTLYRGNLMTPWAQTGQHMIEHMWGQYGDYAKTPFERVPFADDMRAFGITKKDWDVFRQIPPFEPNGRNYILPDAIDKVPNLDPIDAQRIADKFFDYAVKVNRDVSPQISTRELSIAGHALPQNVWQGQQARIFSLVKTFPLMIFTRYLHGVMQQPTFGSKLLYASRFFITLTLAGAFITQMKEMLIRGRDPIDMSPTNWQFWMRAALNGGSFGFAGDILFGTLGAYQHGGFADVMAGPFPTFLDDFKKMTFDDTIDTFVLHKKNTKWAKDAEKFATKYLPIPWQFRLMYQRAIAEELLRMSDPQAYRYLRQLEQRKLTDTGQKSWWPVGQNRPLRTPNLGAAIGREVRR